MKELNTEKEYTIDYEYNNENIYNINDEFLFEEKDRTYNTKNLNSLNQFFKEIGQYKLLSIDEEKAITESIYNIQKEREDYKKKIDSNEIISDDYKKYIEERINEQDKLRNDLVNANYRLVVSVAKNYQNGKFDLMDLIEEGSLGLIKATYGYDPTTGNRFSTYAVNWIKQSISRWIINNTKLIRIPVHIIESMNKINKEEEKFFESNGRYPSNKELAIILNEKEKKIEEVKSSFYSVKYLDEKVSYDNDSTLEEVISDSESINPENVNDEEDLKNEIDKVLKTLSEKEEMVIIYRYGLNGSPKTLEEIGKEMKLTKERVRQIEQNALKKLRSPNKIKNLLCFQ